MIFILNREKTLIKNEKKKKKGSSSDVDWELVSHGIGGFLFFRLVRNLHLSWTLVGSYRKSSGKLLEIYLIVFLFLNFFLNYNFNLIFIF